MSTNPFHSVAIIGGTHGNESTGIQLINKFNENKDLLSYKSMNITTLIANEKACEHKLRFIDEDLNRCFNIENLKESDNHNHERDLAHKIYQSFCTNGHQLDCIIDMHTTVTNMGVTLLPTVFDSYTSTFITALIERYPHKINIVLASQTDPGHQPYVASLAKYGFGFEVGPIPMGALNYYIFKQMEDLVTLSLEIFEEINLGILKPAINKMEYYKVCGTIDFIRDEKNELRVMVHPSLLNSNFRKLSAGMPLFIDFYGNETVYTGKDVYPIFINEPAYYEKGIAMAITEKDELLI